jgi:hypothetical protein
MKTKLYIPICLILLIFNACKKEEKSVTQPVEFTETTYQNLGTFDDQGKPNYLLPKDPISSDLLYFISQNLPDQDLRNAHPEWLASSAIADINITQPSDVFITFVSHGSLTLKNAIAFYTYPTNTPPASSKDIKVITYIFPQAGANTPLMAGDKVKIGRFNAGTSVGFVLLQGAWNSISHNLDTDVVHFCSDDVLNPEIDPKLKKHAVLINYTPENKVLIGFEDLDRTKPECDHDFNDLVMYATVTP